MEGLPTGCNVTNFADGSLVGSPEQELFPLPPLADLSPLSPFDPEPFMQQHEPQIQDLLTSLESSTLIPDRQNDLTSSAGIDPLSLQGHSAGPNHPNSLNLPSFSKSLGQVRDNYNTLPLPPLPLQTRTLPPTLPRSNFQLLPFFPGPPPPVPPKSKHRPSGPFFVLPPPVVPKDNHGGPLLFAASSPPVPPKNNESPLPRLAGALPPAPPESSNHMSLAHFPDTPPPVPPKDNYDPLPRIADVPPPVPAKPNYASSPLAPLPLFAGRPPVPRKDDRITTEGGNIRSHLIRSPLEFHAASYPYQPLRRVPAYENLEDLALEPVAQNEQLPGAMPLQSQQGSTNRRNRQPLSASEIEAKAEERRAKARLRYRQKQQAKVAASSANQSQPEI